MPLSIALSGENMGEEEEGELLEDGFDIAL